MSNVKNYQDMYRFQTHEQMKGALGSKSLSFMSGMKDVGISEFGYLVSVAPKAFEWQQLYQTLQSSLAQGTLQIDDFLFLQNIPSLKQAEKALGTRLKKKQEEAQAAQQQQMEQQSQIDQQKMQMELQMGYLIKRMPFIFMLRA